MGKTRLAHVQLMGFPLVLALAAALVAALAVVPLAAAHLEAVPLALVDLLVRCLEEQQLHVYLNV